MNNRIEMDSKINDEPYVLSVKNDEYHLLVLKNEALGIFNGYVGVREDHRLYCSHYAHDSAVYLLDVHGGVTYCGNNLPMMDRNLWYLGFDTGHYGDFIPNAEGSFDEIVELLFGKDMKEALNLGDREVEFKDVSFVIDEIKKLYDQIRSL